MVDRLTPPLCFSLTHSFTFSLLLAIHDISAEWPGVRPLHFSQSNRERDRKRAAGKKGLRAHESLNNQEKRTENEGESESGIDTGECIVQVSV